MTVIRLACALVFGASLIAAGQDAQSRAAQWKQRLLAPCCWSEEVAYHNSPLAEQIRREIDSLIAAGASDADIEARFVGQYGRRILTEPPGVQGLWLRTVPVIALACGSVLVVLVLRKWSRQNTANTGSPGTV